MNAAMLGVRPRHVILGLLLGASLPILPAQDPATPPAGDTRNQMWWPPTADDWAKPVLITFQRTWEDAVAVSKETGHPILVCVNMDGEPASEHYAGVRYRMPQIAKLYEPYVCVIASVYRHNARDYDEHGHRIPCPRFGSVTCGEHIAIEPFLFERFMEGRRIAPRHIMVELDGKEVYDIYYAMDTASVFQAIGDGIADRALPTPPIVRGDKPIVERVASRDIVDRDAVEKAYRDGDEAMKRSLLAAALKSPDAAPDGLWRQAIFGLDPELSKAAREGLAKSTSESSLDVILEAMRVPLDSSERDQLVGALERIGKTSPRARTLAVVHRGLDARAGAVDVDGWAKALEGGASYAAAADDGDALARVERSAAAAREKPADPNTKAELAAAMLAQVFDPTTAQPRTVVGPRARRMEQLVLEDTERTAREAEQLGAKGWNVDATLALIAQRKGETDEAMRRAEAAMKSLPSDPTSWTAMAVVSLFAEGRQRAIRTAVRAGQEWPKEWMSDVHSAYAVLARHPLGNDRQIASHHDFLIYMGAYGPAAQTLELGLARFPDSWDLHDRFRSQVLTDSGVEGLDAAYAAMLERKDASLNLRWFAGYAGLVQAEFHRRKGDPAAAEQAYLRAVGHYDRWIENNPDSRDTADHYVAIAIGGLARLAFEAGDNRLAVDRVLAAIVRKPDASNALDGLNLSTIDTAKALVARLRAEKSEELAAKLQGVLDSLDPRLLEPPAYERDSQGGSPSPDAQRARQRQRERRGR
ncbi:MAG: hypothetical protein AB7I19_14695 [Planctomycetota bacterium]